MSTGSNIPSELNMSCVTDDPVTFGHFALSGLPVWPLNHPSTSPFNEHIFVHVRNAECYFTKHCVVFCFVF